VIRPMRCSDALSNMSCHGQPPKIRTSLSVTWLQTTATAKRFHESAQRMHDALPQHSVAGEQHAVTEPGIVLKESCDREPTVFRHVRRHIRFAQQDGSRAASHCKRLPILIVIAKIALRLNASCKLQ